MSDTGNIPQAMIDAGARALWEWENGEEPRHERWHQILDGEREHFREQVMVALAAAFAECEVRPELDDGVEVLIDGESYTIVDMDFDRTVVDYRLPVPHAVVLLRPTLPVVVTPAQEGQE